MKKFYRLDLTKSNRTGTIYEGIDYIYLVEGGYCMEFDVLEDMLPPGYCERLRSYAAHIQCIELNDKIDHAPLGVNIDQIPDGVKLEPWEGPTI